MLVFFLFAPFSGQTAKSLWTNILRLVIRKLYDQDLSHSLDISKIISVKTVSQFVIHDACGTWHGFCTVTSIHSIQKSTRNSQKLGNKLVDGIRFKGQNREKSSCKKVWRKRKMFKIRNLLLLHMKHYKICWKNV